MDRCESLHHDVADPKALATFLSSGRAMFFTLTQYAIVQSPSPDRLTNVAPQRTLLVGFHIMQRHTSGVPLDRKNGSALRKPMTSCAWTGEDSV
jgi:hypothetical protein